MKDHDLTSLCAATVEIVNEAGIFIKNEIGKVAVNDIETKSLNSLVSYVDKTAEIRLVERLSSLLPGSSFLTEEAVVIQSKAPFRWVIDPLDGTTNFLHQLPCFAISVALQKNDEVVLGVVLEVNRNECFYAWKGGGAYLNGKPIRVSKTDYLKDGLIATGFPYHDFSQIEAYFKVFEKLMKTTRGIRRWGAAAVDLAYVACGRFDAYFEYALNPWDIAAGGIIVQEAGGEVCDFEGTKNWFLGKSIIAANNRVFSEFHQLIQNGFYK